ncbi:MAG: lipopolysaccharide biosynthesis protein [Alistipes sp.]
MQENNRTVKQQLLSGIFYSSIAKYAGIVVTLVVSGVLARLFTPSEFGVVSVATVIIAFFAIFSDLGIAPAVIQHKQLNERDLSNIFSLTVWSGAVMAGLFFCLSSLIATYYGNPDSLLTICRILSVNLFFASVNIVPNALIQKDKRFKFAAMRSLVVQIAGGTVAVVAALSGVGIYALLINPIFSSVALFVINYRQHPLAVRLHVERASLMKVFSFSAYQFSFQILNYFSRNLDRLLMGRYMGMSQLGFYDKSYQLMMYPLQNIAYVISPVMHPVFSEMQHDLGKLSESYLKVIRVLAFIGLPLSAVLFFTAQELILLIFGPQWIASIPVFRILSLSVGIQIVLSTSGAIFQAANATKMLFYCGLFSSTLNVIAICVGIFVFGTPEAVAASICISFFINFVQCYYAMFRQTFHVSWMPFWRSFLSPLLLTGLLCMLLFPLSALLPSQNNLLSLVLKSGVGLLVWGCYIQLGGVYDIRGKIVELVHKLK